MLKGGRIMIAKTSQKQIQKVNHHESAKQETVAGVKYQNIIYYMDNRIKKVSQEQNTQVDFIKATSEMDGLNWKYEKNFIGFDNRTKHECVQFIRQGQDKWYAEAPIMHGVTWDGYAWCSHSDSKTVTDLIRLFFEEVPWFEMLSWKMMRFKH
jgi:hypothetical protein